MNENKRAVKAPESGPTVAGAFGRELARLIVDELEERGLVGGGETAPALLDRQGIAKALHVGVDTIDRLRREGMPELRVGDSPRFELDHVLEWLRGRRG